MHPIAVISGIGLVTPLGATADATWAAVCAGQSIRHHSRAADGEASPDRIFSLAESAAREATHDGGLSGRHLDTIDLPLVLATSKGPVETWLPQGESGCPLPKGEWERPAREVGWGLSDVASVLANRVGLHGARLTISAACASGLHALIRGALMIQSGEARRVLVVAAEAAVHPLFVGSFQRLGVLAQEGAGCRPFDRDRSGFYMSEAAAAVLLESSDVHSAERPFIRTPEAEPQATPRIDRNGLRNPIATSSASSVRVCIERCALGGDATHLTSSDERQQTLRHLLARVIDRRPIDLVHAHGTGTQQNDPAELAAIEATLADVNRLEPPHLYSHKGALGHSQGAAGLVSVVLNVLAHRHGMIPPNACTQNPLPSNVTRIDQRPVQRDVRRSLCIAAGFGGPIGAVALRTMGAS